MADTEPNPLLKYLVSDPDAFAHNLARAFEHAGHAASAWLKPRETGESEIGSTDDLARITKTLARVGEWWLADPARTLEAQNRLTAGWLDLMESTVKRMSGEPYEPAIRPETRDKRFQDPEWHDNAFFDFLKQFYLLTSRWAEEMVEEAADLDPHTRAKADFWVRQIVAALSPSNFILTNPELLRETASSHGENLVRGMKMLAEDIVAGGGDLRIRQADYSKFEIGRNLAVTPGKVVFQNDVCQVIQYEPTTETVRRRPLLIVPPWINKFYILDLNPEKSFVRWAVAEGLTVFVVSWINPDERQAEKSFEHYMKEGVLAAVDVVEKATGESEIDAVGYCVGGTLLAVTLAWAAATGDERIRSATFFTTQVDFTHAGELLVFVDEEQISSLEQQMRGRGYLEGRNMATAFNMLRSNDLIWPYFINNYLKGKEPFPFDLLYWNSDSTRMPAANHSFYLRNCYLDNNLSTGRMEVGGVRLDLGKVRIPIFNLAAKEDHIAPALSVFEGCRSFGGPVDYVLAGSGHIAGVINPVAKPKYQYWSGGPPQGTLAEWTARATETPGSWWPHWRAWLDAHDADRVPARIPGGGVLEPIEDAPGSYVRMRA
jgi:polyhydroxyalkanoate synthase